MTRRLVFMLVMLSSPAFADIPAIDTTVLDSRESRFGKTIETEKIEHERYAHSHGVTCSVYRPARKGDPVAAANANPAITRLVRRIAREEGIDENQFLALVYQESRFNPCAQSRAGAQGLAQLMPGTAKDLGVDARIVEQNLRGGARYYKQQLRRFNGNVSLALAAYNSGFGNVEKYGGIPPFRETQRYVANITQRWLPAFGGLDKSSVPQSFGGSKTAFEAARETTLLTMGLAAATGAGSSDVISWFEQPGATSAGTIHDSWDRNAQTRSANMEMINRLVLLSTAFAELTNSRNIMTASGLSGASRSNRYAASDTRDIPPTSASCGKRQRLAWDVEANACVRKSNLETAQQFTPH